MNQREKIAQCAERFEAFTGHGADSIERVRVKPVSVACVVGTLDAVAYTCVRDGKTLHYQHEFKKHARPLLAVSPDGRSIVIVGGRFEFTEAGFTDDPK